MKLDACDKDPLRVLRDVLRQFGEGAEYSYSVAAAIDRALVASSAATRASDGPGAETRPPSAVPEAKASPQEQLQAWIYDAHADFAPSICARIAAKAAELFTAQADMDDALAAAREAGRRERDAEVAALQDCLARVTAERDAYKRDFEAELAGARGQREKYGAREDETMLEFVARLANDAHQIPILEQYLDEAEQQFQKKVAELAAIQAERGNWADGQAALAGQLAEAQAEVERLHKHLNHSNAQWRVEFDRGCAAGRREGILAAAETLLTEFCSCGRLAKCDTCHDAAAIRSLLSEPEPEKPGQDVEARIPSPKWTDPDDPAAWEPRTHDLKTWPQFFEAILSGVKTFELRKNDRGFRKDDTLRLHEWDPEIGRNTGRVIERKVSYILADAEPWGLRQGFALMALAPSDREYAPEASPVGEGRPKFGWICEFCYAMLPPGTPLPAGWERVPQSVICPECRVRVKAAGGIAVVKGGAFASGPDPRAVPETPPQRRPR